VIKLQNGEVIDFEQLYKVVHSMVGEIQQLEERLEHLERTAARVVEVKPD